MTAERGRIEIEGFDADRVEQRSGTTVYSDAPARSDAPAGSDAPARSDAPAGSDATARSDATPYGPTTTEETAESTPVVRRRSDRWHRVLDHLRRDRTAMLGLAVVLTMSLLAIFARPIVVGGVSVQPFALAPYDPTVRVAYQGSEAGVYAPPSLQHPMGTDGNGRDVFSRVLYGGRYSISIGLVVVALTASFGLVYGAIAGYYGGWTDDVLMRVVDVVFAVPALVLALVIVAMLGGGYWQLVAAFALPGWAAYARIVRGEVIAIREAEYVLAARAIGARDRTILATHVLPKAVAPLVVQASLSVGTVVIGVAALGFLGLGLESGTPEWGTMLEGARSTLIAGPGGSVQWWATVFPGAAIFAFVLATNLFGDGLNDALDARSADRPRQGGGG